MTYLIKPAQFSPATLPFSGSYFNSRMIGDNVYVVISQPALIYNDWWLFQQFMKAKMHIRFAINHLLCADMVDTSYTFTSFFGLNSIDDAQNPTNMTVYDGLEQAQCMFPPDNIYVTYPDWRPEHRVSSLRFTEVRINGLLVDLWSRRQRTWQCSKPVFNGWVQRKLQISHQLVWERHRLAMFTY